MRIGLLALPISLAPLVLAAQQKVNIQRAATEAPSVRLSGAVGALRIVGWDRDSISLTGGLGAGSRLDGGPLSTSGPVGGLKFYVEAADESSLHANRLELRVPKKARLWIKMGSADIEAAGVTGGLDLNIVGGSVRVTGDPRELLVESMDGSVSVTGRPSYARLKTATGDITIRGGGEDLNVSTVSGTIVVSDGTIERGRFESVTGPITFAADLTRGADARFDTHSGAIELRLKRPSDFEIDAATITGAIENRWSAAPPGVGREGRGMELGISSGMGGARVSIRSFKGNVKLVGR